MNVCCGPVLRGHVIDVCRYMATSGADRKLKVWDLRTLKQLCSCVLTAGAGHMAFSQRTLLACAVDRHVQVSVKVKVKVYTLDIAPLHSKSPPQKCSGMARVLKGFNSFTCTPTRSSTIGMSHTCLCFPSRSWYSFTDPGGMDGWVDLGAK